MKILPVDNAIYMYDAKSQFISEIEIKDIECENEEHLINSSALEKYAEFGIFQKGAFQKVVPEVNEINDLVEYQLNSFFPRKFTIEVTESCNLRCKYCFFAREEDVARKHSFRKMEIKTVHKAIDFYFNLYTSLLMKVPEYKREKLIAICPPKLSWWGGEPFIAFDIMRESKQYFDSLNWTKYGIKLNRLVYIVVSNLTIMNEAIEEFLVKNNVLLHVSLDGGKEEHDANRVFLKEKGSFDTVMRNLMHLIEKYPDYSKKRIIIQSVTADNINIKKSYDFMHEQFKINSSNRLILKYIVYNLKKERQLFSESQMQNEIVELETFDKILKILSEKKQKDFTEYLQNNHDFLQEFETLFLLERKLVFENPQSNDYYLDSFSCPIGSDSVFVAANGDFHMCMKSDYSFPIGNVFTELDKNAIVSLYKKHLSGFREKCKNCWAINFCQVCPAQTLYENDFYFPTNKDCVIIRNNAAIALKKYILFTRNENMYNQIKKFFDDPVSNSYALDTGPININNLNFLRYVKN